jgi:hypothetical protein
MFCCLKLLICKHIQLNFLILMHGDGGVFIVRRKPLILFRRHYSGTCRNDVDGDVIANSDDTPRAARGTGKRVIGGSVITSCVVMVTGRSGHVEC